MSQAARHNKQHGRRKGSDADHPTARVGTDQRRQGRLRWLGAGKEERGETQRHRPRLLPYLLDARGVCTETACAGSTFVLKPHARRVASIHSGQASNLMRSLCDAACAATKRLFEKLRSCRAIDDVTLTLHK